MREKLDIKIYGGNKIGGCVTEIKSNDIKIILDYGNNLDDTEQEEIEGLTKGKPSYNAVFISHYHLDHIGAINKILEEIPVYVEETTKKLYDIICDFSNKPKIEAQTFRLGDVIQGKELGSLRIETLRVDHSAYNSAMFVITNGYEKALYTGDFRNNGYKGYNFIPTIKKIGKVDYLITEGTNIGNNTHIVREEKSLVDEFIPILRKYEQVFVLMSASNIDRITTLQKACNKTNHIFIQDLYMAHLTSLIEKEDKTQIPNPITYKDLMVYNPKYFNRKNEEFKNKYLKCFENKTSKCSFAKPFVMNVRTSMIEDLEELKGNNQLTNSCLIYSMWQGYKQKENVKEFLEKVEDLGVELIKMDIHTSGHASKKLIEQVKNIVNPKQTYVIHTEDNNVNKNYFNKESERP